MAVWGCGFGAPSQRNTGIKCIKKAPFGALSRRGDSASTDGAGAPEPLKAARLRGMESCTLKKTEKCVLPHDSTESVRCKGPIPTKVKKFYPVYKSRIVKSRENAGTGAGVRSYRGRNLMREKAFAESRRGVKKSPGYAGGFLAVHGHPCGRPPEERNGPGLFRVSQRPWKVKAAGRFFQRRVKAGL